MKTARQAPRVASVVLLTAFLTGTLISAGVETCELCHGEGRSADVEVMHGVSDFQFN